MDRSGAGESADGAVPTKVQRKLTLVRLELGDGEYELDAPLTFDGSIGAAEVVLSAPLSHDGSLNGRENLALWQLDPRAPAPPTPKLIGRLWGCKGAYSAFSQEGGSTIYNLFEAGETYRYEKLMLARWT